MNNGDMPASPIIYADMGHNGQREIFCENTGLTKRESFAMAAMQGLCNAHDVDGTWAHDARDVAMAAVQYADALLAELAKGKSK